MKNVLALVLIFFSMSLFAHDGAHGPTQKMAPHGGVLMDGKFFMSELVQSDQGIKLYFLTHESKPINPSELILIKEKISFLDSKKKPVSFELVNEKESILVKFDKTKSYRFNLAVPVTYGKKKDDFKWGFEPQSN